MTITKPGTPTQLREYAERVEALLFAAQAVESFCLENWGEHAFQSNGTLAMMQNRLLAARAWLRDRVAGKGTRTPLRMTCWDDNAAKEARA